jgi:hypothetical protein
VAVGYDDQEQWLIVRNSWSDAWGLTSHFTLPYQYSLEATLSDDFWTIRMVQTPTGKAAGCPSSGVRKRALNQVQMVVLTTGRAS